MKKALIIGVTGQDGAYLSEFLLNKGYEVHGLKRRASLFNTDRINHLYESQHQNARNFFLHYGDLTDSLSLFQLISEIKPDEIYNLGAQSHVQVSFGLPEYTANVDGLGTLRILEAIRIAGLTLKTRFYQASTSELFGKVATTPQMEKTPFYPRSPYACAKLFAYWITVNYREAYDMYACNGILFNHESPVRGETFVTRKITRGLSRICLGLSRCIYLGNLEAKRDWGHARDYARMQWLMLQQDIPEDFVIATGAQYSVKDFVKAAAKILGITLCFQGTSSSEIAIVEDFDINRLEQLAERSVPCRLKKGSVIVRIDPKYFRPTEVDTLLGDATKAAIKLGWKPTISFEELVLDMVRNDLNLALRDALTKAAGFKNYNYEE